MMANYWTIGPLGRWRLGPCMDVDLVEGAEERPMDTVKVPKWCTRPFYCPAIAQSAATLNKWPIQYPIFNGTLLVFALVLLWGQYRLITWPL